MEATVADSQTWVCSAVWVRLPYATSLGPQPSEICLGTLARGSRFRSLIPGLLAFFGIVGSGCSFPLASLGTKVR